MKFNKTKEKALIGVKPELIQELYKEKGHSIWAVKCPYCNNFFKSRKSSIESGNTKSCGCLKIKTAQKMGKSNKKNNVLYQPLHCDYTVGFFLDGKDKFLIHKEKEQCLKNFTCYPRKRQDESGKIDVYIKINNKTVYLHDFLNNTDVKNGEQCDHINQETRDNRDCNTRNCTQQMNLLNRKIAENKKGEMYEKDNKFIVKFPYVGEFVFDTKEEAEEKYNYLHEYTYKHSQEIAKEIETYEFKKPFHYLNGILAEIECLPERNYHKRILKNIEIWLLKGIISEDYASKLQFKLINDYKKYKKEMKGV